MNTKRLTKRDHFNTLLTLSEVKANEALVEFINRELELLDKKNANKKPTKTQQENEVLKATISDVLGEADKPMTVSEIMKGDPSLGELSNQRVSAILRQMKDDDKTVVRSEVKGKAYFALA